MSSSGVTRTAGVSSLEGEQGDVQLVDGAGADGKVVKWNDTTKQLEDATADLNAAYVAPAGKTTPGAAAPQPFVNVLDYGAVGDGVTDDSGAFAAAMAASKYVKCAPNKTYIVSNLADSANSILDLNGSTLQRKAGTRNAYKATQYGSKLLNGSVKGGGEVSTTTSAGASAGATAITVTSATGLAAQQTIFYVSAWEAGVEVNEIASVVGTTVNLVAPLKGNVANGAQVLADFAVIEIAGAAALYAAVEDISVQTFLVGAKVGGEGTGAASFNLLDRVVFNDFVGCAVYEGPNITATNFGNVRINAGRTLTSDYTGDGTTVRFNIPFSLRKQVDRWGTQPSIRLLVNGVAKTATTDYTIDTAAWQIVATAAPANGAVVQVQNYEYAAFGRVAKDVTIAAPSSLQQINDEQILACRVGMLLDGCQLGYVNQTQVDTCSYAGIMLLGCSDTHLRAVTAAYSPFPIIIDGSCVDISLTGWDTSLVPDASEFTPTANKKEITVRTGATNIAPYFASWFSKSGYTASIATGTTPPPMTGLLASQQYAPGSQTVSNGGGAALTAFDATNLTVIFTAPPGGAVILEFEGYLSATANGFATNLGWFTHGTSTVVGILDEFTSAPYFSTVSPITFRQKLTGLTPGTAYHLDLCGAVASGTIQVVSVGVTTAGSGNQGGPSLITVTAA